MEALLKRITAQIVYLVEPSEIILFGSVAAGEQRSGSDIDLLIINEWVIHHRQKLAGNISGFIAQYGYRSDVLLRSRAEVEMEMATPQSFLFNALKKAKKIYIKKG